jgi:RNA polymerase sigma-70 factor (ECF subfamily)
MKKKQESSAGSKEDDVFMLAIAQGDNQAFEKLFLKHSGAVLGYAQRLLAGNRNEAEDISQSCWIKVVQAAPNYEPKNQFRAWLMTIVRNLVFSQYRDLKWEKLDASEEAKEIEDPSSSMDQLIEKSESAEQVKKALESLPDSQRIALSLWMNEDLSYEEMATQLRTTVSSVKSILFRAKENLQSKLRTQI